jgi:hypothetical protein
MESMAQLLDENVVEIGWHVKDGFLEALDRVGLGANLRNDAEAIRLPMTKKFSCGTIWMEVLSIITFQWISGCITLFFKSKGRHNQGWGILPLDKWIYFHKCFGNQFLQFK